MVTSEWSQEATVVDGHYAQMIWENVAQREQRGRTNGLPCAVARISGRSLSLPPSAHASGRPTTGQPFRVCGGNLFVWPSGMWGKLVCVTPSFHKHQNACARGAMFAKGTVRFASAYLLGDLFVCFLAGYQSARPDVTLVTAVTLS